MLADLSESLHGVRIVTAHNRQRHNVIHHRNVVGEYRDANNYTAQVNAIYGPGTQLLGVLGQARPAGRRWRHGPAPHLSSAPWWPSSCTSTGSSSPSSCWSSSTTPTSRGGLGYQAARPARHRAHRDGGGRGRRPPAHRRARSSFDRVTFGYEPGAAGHRGCQPHDRTGRDGGLRRADRGGQVDAGQAGHPLLRPDRRPGPHRRPRPAPRDDGLVAPPARRGPPGAVPVRRDHPRQHRLRPPGRARRRG